MGFEIAEILWDQSRQLSTFSLFTLFTTVYVVFHSHIITLFSGTEEWATTATIQLSVIPNPSLAHGKIVWKMV